MAAEIFTAISALRMVLNSETDADSPDNETSYGALRVAIESLFMILLGTGFDGTVSGISTTTITHADAAQGTDTHNGRTTIMTSGACKGNFYTIDDSDDQTLIHTGDDPEADGVEIGDTFVVLFDIKANLDGHDHDAINSKNVVLADASIATAKYGVASVDQTALGASCVGISEVKVGVGNAGASLAAVTEVAVPMQDYCFFPSIYGQVNTIRMNAGDTAGATYVGRFALYNVSSDTAYNWTAYWRYITATDEQFIYAVRDTTTGEVIGTWMCDDPPPGYWGLDSKPDDFIPPLRFTPALTNVDEIVLFKYPKDGYKELEDRSKADKVMIHDMLTADFDFNSSTKLFTAKNLVHI